MHEEIKVDFSWDLNHNEMCYSSNREVVLQLSNEIVSRIMHKLCHLSIMNKIPRQVSDKG